MNILRCTFSEKHKYFCFSMTKNLICTCLSLLNTNENKCYNFPDVILRNDNAHSSCVLHNSIFMSLC